MFSLAGGRYRVYSILVVGLVQFPLFHDALLRSPPFLQHRVVWVVGQIEWYELASVFTRVSYALMSIELILVKNAVGF